MRQIHTKMHSEDIGMNKVALPIHNVVQQLDLNNAFSHTQLR